MGIEIIKHNWNDPTPRLSSVRTRLEAWCHYLKTSSASGAIRVGNICGKWHQNDFYDWCIASAGAKCVL